ncbi:hypothetical protein [Rahnella sp. ChDrAdgB13]|uniref:hypothetical protein n=1 Tax=Rahnella sp. ChDrAdgB13 TaxID=1850581 RepID=UPI00186B91F2|nr:hypothetical protein [Rahnella sp. ChDrAdgB13]
MDKQDMKVIADQLLEKIERLELAANRGIKISEDPHLRHCSGKIISPEQCYWTLKECALFKKWVTECFESFELTVVPSSHGLEQ